jgi:peptide-methionine (R)-S-oxide reductase
MKFIIKNLLCVVLLSGSVLTACGQSKKAPDKAPAKAPVAQVKPVAKDKMEWNKLTAEEEHVIVNKGTECTIISVRNQVRIELWLAEF